MTRRKSARRQHCLVSDGNAAIARQQETIRLVNKALADMDLQQLRKLACVRGLVNNGLRERVWTVLSGAKDSEPINLEAYETWAAVEHRDRNVVKVDVDRSLFTLLHDVSEEELHSKRQQLQRLLNAVVGKHSVLEQNAEPLLPGQTPTQQHTVTGSSLASRKKKKKKSRQQQANKVVIEHTQVQSMTHTNSDEEVHAADAKARVARSTRSHAGRGESANGAAASQGSSTRRSFPSKLLCMSQPPQTLTPSESDEDVSASNHSPQEIVADASAPSGLLQRFSSCLRGTSSTRSLDLPQEQGTCTLTTPQSISADGSRNACSPRSQRTSLDGTAISNGITISPPDHNFPPAIVDMPVQHEHMMTDLPSPQASTPASAHTHITIMTDDTAMQLHPMTLKSVREDKDTPQGMPVTQLKGSDSTGYNSVEQAQEQEMNSNEADIYVLPILPGCVTDEFKADSQQVAKADKAASLPAEPLCPADNREPLIAAAPPAPKLKPMSQNVFYYQGLHDIASVLLLVCSSESAAFPLLSRLTQVQLRDATSTTLTPTMEVLGLLYPLLSTVDPELAAHLQSADLPPFFAVSWLITWFSHDVKDVQVAARLFDLFLASHPLMPLYVGIAMMVGARDHLLACHEMPELHRELVNLQITDYPLSGWGCTHVRDPQQQANSPSHHKHIGWVSRSNSSSRSSMDATQPTSPVSSVTSVSAFSDRNGRSTTQNAASTVDALIAHALHLYKMAPPSQLVKKFKIKLTASVSPSATLVDNVWQVPETPVNANQGKARGLKAMIAAWDDIPSQGGPLQRLARFARQLRGGNRVEPGNQDAAQKNPSPDRKPPSRMRTVLQIGGLVSVYLVAAAVSYVATWGGDNNEGTGPAVT